MLNRWTGPLSLPPPLSLTRQLWVKSRGWEITPSVFLSFSAMLIVLWKQSRGLGKCWGSSHGGWGSVGEPVVCA